MSIYYGLNLDPLQFRKLEKQQNWLKYESSGKGENKLISSLKLHKLKKN